MTLSITKTRICGNCAHCEWSLASIAKPALCTKHRRPVYITDTGCRDLARVEGPSFWVTYYVNYAGKLSTAGTN